MLRLTYMFFQGKYKHSTLENPSDQKKNLLYQIKHQILYQQWDLILQVSTVPSWADLTPAPHRCPLTQNSRIAGKYSALLG